MADDLIEATRAKGLCWGRQDGVLVTRDDFVQEARAWIGTPFLHQADKKGVATDCGGLVRGVSVVLGLIPVDYRRYFPDEVAAYGRRGKGNLGLGLCELFWKRIGVHAAKAGDVIVFKWKSGPPQHIGVLADYRHGGLSVIHALGPASPNKVLEQRLDELWMGRAVAAFHIAGVEE